LGTRSPEKRPYRKKRRAELEEQTRRRITESAVELHGTLAVRITAEDDARVAAIERAIVSIGPKANRRMINPSTRLHVCHVVPS